MLYDDHINIQARGKERTRISPPFCFLLFVSFHAFTPTFKPMTRSYKRRLADRVSRRFLLHRSPDCSLQPHAVHIRHAGGCQQSLHLQATHDRRGASVGLSEHLVIDRCIKRTFRLGLGLSSTSKQCFFLPEALDPPLFSLWRAAATGGTATTAPPPLPLRCLTPGLLIGCAHAIAAAAALLMAGRPASRSGPKARTALTTRMQTDNTHNTHNTHTCNDVLRA